MWSAAVSFYLRLIHRTFLFQKIYCQEEGKTLTRSVLYVEELCSFQFSKRIICTGWVSPWFKSSGERASVSERMCSGPFGMSSGQGQEYKGLVFNLFLKYVLRFIQPWNDVFLLEQFEVWELNGRWIWELKLRRDDSSVEMLRDREFLRTGRMYFWEIVHTVVLNIFAGQWSGYNSRLCAGRPLGFVLNWRNDERELVERFFCGDGGCKTLTISQDRQKICIFQSVQTVVLKNCRTCAASACYVRKLDHWLCQVLTFLESLVRV